MDSNKCFLSRASEAGVCHSQGCPHYIYSQQHHNCVKLIDREMSPTEISLVTGMSLHQINETLKNALSKLKRKAERNKLSMTIEHLKELVENV